MNQPERPDLFHAAVVAFEIRFDAQLASRWQELEGDAATAIASDPSESNKHSLLNRFFDDTQEELANSVHEYFPKLLRIAATGRRHLGHQSPLDWTEGQMWIELCNFLGIERTFDPNSAPRDNNRIFQSALRVSTNRGWYPDESPAELLLPWWVESRWGFSRSLRLESHVPHSPDDTQPLSLADTQKWIKYKEFWMYRKLETQIEREKLDGVIEAGMSGISVLEGGHIQTVMEYGEAVGENHLRREFDTWEIKFAGETCRLRTMLGLEYISILLEYPLRSMTALELKALASGIPTKSRYRSELEASFLEDGVTTVQSSDEEAQSHSQKSFSRDDLLDDKGKSKIEQRLRDLEMQIADRLTIGDTETVCELKEEHSKIESFLERSLNLFGRSRPFTNENERARQSITQALTRAYDEIGVHCPKAAQHFKSQIARGSKFIYRDGTTSWLIRRNS